MQYPTLGHNSYLWNTSCDLSSNFSKTTSTITLQCSEICWYIDLLLDKHLYLTDPKRSKHSIHTEPPFSNGCRSKKSPHLITAVTICTTGHQTQALQEPQTWESIAQTERVRIRNSVRKVSVLLFLKIWISFWQYLSIQAFDKYWKR